MFAGSIELLQPGQNCDHIAGAYADFVKAVKETVVDSLDIELSINLIQTLDIFVTELIKKQDEGIDVSMCKQHLPDLLSFLIKCQTAYMTFKLQKKPIPENIKASKERAMKVMKDLTKLSGSDRDFFDS